MRLAAAVLALCAAGPAAAQTIVDAAFDEPTDRYDHGILGDALEWGALRVRVRAATGGGIGSHTLRLPQDAVFEDTAPRLWDVTGDGAPEVVAVQTSLALGARLLVMGLADGQLTALAATPYIGQTHRWLAPAGAADLDGDGRIEIAYVDRPHLDRVLRILRMVPGDAGGWSLEEVAAVPGLTNHRIGDRTISGGLRDCGTGPSIVTASADWSRIVATTFDGKSAATADLGPLDAPDAMARALACQR